MNWRQLQSILWLRWRLTRNQWSRGGAVSAVVTLIVVCLGIGAALAGSVAGVVVGVLVLGKAEPLTLLLVWDGIIGGFLFFWLLGILTEIQRSETVDLGKLLHLPISLREVFLLNYLASHFTISLVLFLPAMLGLSVGLILSAGWRMVFLPPLILSFVFWVTAWTYCLRGWLIALMVNQRRRRAILVGITMAIVLASQLPNLYFNVIQREHRAKSHRAASHRADGAERTALLPAFLAAHPFVPPLWVGHGAMALASGNLFPALGASAGGLLLGALGLRRAYNSTVRFYQGGASGKVRPKAETRPSKALATLFVEWHVPAVPEEAGALALALIRSMSRAPEVKMALASNFIALLVVVATFFARKAAAGDTVKLFMATAMVALPFMGLLQLMCNQFGLDRDGFRALVLLPTRRQHILLAKNLSFLPLALGMGVVLLAVGEILVGLPWLVVPAAILQLGTLFLLLSMAGNLVSVLAPYRVAAGSLKPTKAPAMKMLLIFLTHLLFPLAMVPIFIPAGLGMLSASFGWLPAAWVDLILSIVLAGGVAGLYAVTLESTGTLLQRREKAILQAVTQETE